MGFLSFRRSRCFHGEPYGFIIIALLYIGALNPLIDFFRWIIQSVIRIFSFNNRISRWYFVPAVDQRNKQVRQRKIAFCRNFSLTVLKNMNNYE